MQYGFSDHQPNEYRLPHATHTPARTLVMSKTRIPANGSLGESAAAVARPVQCEQSRPLSRMRGRRYLVRPIDVLDVAIMNQKQDAELEVGKHVMSFEQSTNRWTSASDSETVPRYHHHSSNAFFLPSPLLHTVNNVHRHSRSDRQ